MSTGSKARSYLLRWAVMVGLGLAVLGQLYFTTRREYLGNTDLRGAVRPGAGSRGSRVREGPFRAAETESGRCSKAKSKAFRVLMRRRPATYWDVLTIWVSGVVLTALACVERWGPPGRDAALALVLALVGLGLRL